MTFRFHSLTVKFYLISMRVLVEFLRTIWCSNWFVASCRGLCPEAPSRGIYSTWWTWLPKHLMKLTKIMEFCILAERYCNFWAQMSSDDPRWLQMTQADPRWPQMVPDEPRWCQMGWDEHLRWPKTSPDDPRWLQVILDDPRCADMSPDDLRWSQTQVIPDDPRWSRWYQMIPGEIISDDPSRRWPKMVADVYRWSKMMPDDIRWSQMIPDDPRMIPEWSQTTWFQMMISDGPRWSQIIPDDPRMIPKWSQTRWFQMISAQMISDGPRWSQMRSSMIPDDPRWAQMIPWSKMIPDDPMRHDFRWSQPQMTLDDPRWSQIQIQLMITDTDTDTHTDRIDIHIPIHIPIHIQMHMLRRTSNRQPVCKLRYARARGNQSATSKAYKQLLGCFAGIFFYLISGNFIIFEFYGPVVDPHPPYLSSKY